MAPGRTPVRGEVSTTSPRLLRISWMLLSLTLVYVIVTAAWVATGNRSLLPVLEILTIWSAVALVLFMVEIHRGAAEVHRSGSLTALLLTGAMAVVTISNHFWYLTVLPQLYGDAEMPSWLLLDGWPSIPMGLECVAWGVFLGLAMLFAATPAGSLGGPVAWTLRVSGVLTLAGLVGPVTGRMGFYHLSTAGYSVGFLLLSIEVIQRARRGPVWPDGRTGRL